MWRAGELEKTNEGLQKRVRKSELPENSQWLQGSSRIWERNGHYHHYGPGLAWSPSPLWAGEVVWHVCDIFTGTVV